MKLIPNNVHLSQSPPRAEEHPSSQSKSKPEPSSDLITFTAFNKLFFHIHVQQNVSKSSLVCLSESSHFLSSVSLQQLSVLSFNWTFNKFQFCFIISGNSVFITLSVLLHTHTAVISNTLLNSPSELRPQELKQEFQSGRGALTVWRRLPLTSTNTAGRLGLTLIST